ncbi:MAG TPA: hypothetical protein ACHBZ9_01800, partial [Arsenophonus nasoniae]
MTVFWLFHTPQNRLFGCFVVTLFQRKSVKAPYYLVKSQFVHCLSFHHIRLGGILAVLYNNKEEKIMSKKNDIPTFPIAGWKIGPLPGY